MLTMLLFLNTMSNILSAYSRPLLESCGSVCICYRNTDCEDVKLFLINTLLEGGIEYTTANLTELQTAATNACQPYAKDAVKFVRVPVDAVVEVLDNGTMNGDFKKPAGLIRQRIGIGA